MTKISSIAYNPQNIVLKNILLLSLIAFTFYCCSNSGKESIENNGSIEPSSTISIPEIDSLSLFVNGFRKVEKLSISIDNELFDSTQVIPDEFIAKYGLAEDFIKFYRHYYGIRYSVNDSIQGLVYHYRYFHGMNMEFGNVSNDYEGSDILFISSSGKIVGKLPGVYDRNLENYPVQESNYSKSSSTVIKSMGDIVIYSSEKFGVMKDGDWSEYQETEKEYQYSWKDSNLIMDRDAIVGYSTERVNNKSRKSIVESLTDIKDIVFVPITKRNDSYFRIKSGCVEGRGEFRFMMLNTSGTFESISDNFCPVFINEANEYSIYIITSATFDSSNTEYSAKLIDFSEGERKPDYDKEAWDLAIIKSSEGFWRMKNSPDDWLENQGIIFADKEFASTLELTDSPCTEQ